MAPQTITTELTNPADFDGIFGGLSSYTKRLVPGMKLVYKETMAVSLLGSRLKEIRSRAIENGLKTESMESIRKEIEAGRSRVELVGEDQDVR